MISLPGADLGPFAYLAQNLQEITEALAATTTQREVIEIVLTPTVQAIGASAGIVLLVNQTDQQLKIAGSQGYEDGPPTLWQEGPINDHVLIADILRMREALYFEDAGALKAAYPELERRTGGLLPVANATLPMFLDGQPLGVIVLDFTEPHHFTLAERRFLKILSAQCAVALGRAEATVQLEARVEERTRQLKDEQTAQAAFVTFTEAVGSETDLPTLIQQAITLLQRRFPGASIVYYEQEGKLWRARVWSEDMRPELVAVITAGLPVETPLFAEVAHTRQPVFTDVWDAEREGVAASEEYSAAANYPLVLEGKLHRLLSIGLRDTRTWSEADKVLLRSVGRSLNLALERTETTRQLALQNTELQARTRALEAFAELTRDLALTTDPLLLIRRAQEVVVSMLADGAALYYVPEGDQWYNRVQHGALRSPELQATIDGGLPYAETHNLLIPWTTGQPYYQDVYDQDTDNLPSLTGHIGATAALPLRVEGTLTGILVFALFDQRRWSNVDQVVLEAVVQSLELALRRAESVAELEMRSREVTEWRERYEVAVQGSGDLLYDWDPATDVILYGGAVEQITGYAVQELKGNLADWTERLIHPDDREPFAQEIARAVASSGEAHMAFRLLHKDGSIREVEDDGYFKRDAQGEVTQMVGFVKDVTERKQAERALLRLNEELRRSNKELEQFAYIASHDLQAPIRAVTSFAGLIGKRYGDKLDERGQLYLQQIVDGGEHMKRLVDDLLTFSRVHTEQRPPVPTDTERVFDTVASRLQAQSPGGAITRGELPVVQADAQQLDQLLQNLISNGLKYRRADVTPEVQVSAERDGELWRFAVSDNGIGVEPQYFERIFEIFQRLHGRESFEGTGIGLAVCKKIVERHGGQLWLESSPGLGSTFFFTLPNGEG
ncbi:GAF domain-containing protein [Deinococcus sp. QL22]|uniref:GAF domain-containing protein n=1 Tax=Deinococcus sp. QL22 TaxID=2939437 RepID=UPI002016B7E8|nr:GAF domain-containing protein [Deinococcus sp. QL22]UQN08989.1 GAF domain-containing protein [Deinococcus sp. QL22]